ncbi:MULTISPECIES: hypothetical protein [Anoxybacillaceae]|jgi:hypothetical protein|uniref:Uncharacterized protein n=3 Tax=Anoxybacillaceae TaxID=3120669 RepID=A0A023DKK4_9BACL|nr:MULTISPECIES: hypothetical protein [Bacillaceae]MBB3854573.1 hypothetical protein [Parageobacillus caldoxylosilyticus]MBB3907416.1 hypothetical protein [Anoxybacillus rupiensis]MDE8564560.1 hypothetical protein [Anoxybacillus rupiensis]MED5053803.1 hypothetical protein [Anoxybacillus rupiensis]OXB94219.1 hypothetical protein B9L23_04800 [Parageobacillus galactosidasius]
MNPVLENIKFKLSNRANSVLYAREENFYSEIKIFLDFIKSNSLLSAIIHEIEKLNFDIESYLKGDERRHRRFIEYPNDYIQKIALCYSLMKLFSENKLSVLDTLFLNITPSRSIDDRCRVIAQQYFKPLYEYICEQIEDGSTILYLLLRYKHRTEWFHKDRLFSIYESDTKRGEENLTLDLQEYLHNQGIDYPFSTPHSPSGRSDLVGLIETNDPMVLEVKLFNLEKGYDKAYIRKGLVQAYRYAIDYGKPTGYLLIYNLDKRDLSFEKNDDSPIKSVKLGDKEIYIIVVNLYSDGKSASEIKKPLPYIIDDTYLLNFEEE